MYAPQRRPFPVGHARRGDVSVETFHDRHHEHIWNVDDDDHHIDVSCGLRPFAGLTERNDGHREDEGSVRHAPHRGRG